MKRIKEGEMIWSDYFNDWIKVLKIQPDGFFWFSLKGEKQLSKTTINHFEIIESI